jgi:hypothetical protein
MIDSIIKGVKTVAKVMDAVNFFGGGKGDDDRGTPLVPPRVNFPGRVSTAIGRSTAGVPRFSDVPEATFYKYAQLQNTVRYLYNKKAGFRSIAKG